MNRILPFFFFLLLQIPLFGQSDSQCGCDSATTFEQQYEAANVVVLGTCLRVNSNPIKGGLNVVFGVDSSWKRGIELTATVHTNSVGQCGVDFRPGERYLVFAHKKHQTIETSVCEYNFPAEGIDAEKLMKVLGKGFSPGRPEMARRMSMLVLFLGIGGLLFVAFVIFRKKIFKGKSQATA